MLVRPTMPKMTPRYDGKWEVGEDWVVEFAAQGRRYMMTVRAGFVTDGASVPRMAWMLAGPPMESPRVAAALAHDWLYSAHVTTRDEADAAFFALCRLVGIPLWRCVVEWIALWAFGERAWYSHGRADAARARRRGWLVEI